MPDLELQYRVCDFSMKTQHTHGFSGSGCKTTHNVMGMSRLIHNRRGGGGGGEWPGNEAS